MMKKKSFLIVGIITLSSLAVGTLCFASNIQKASKLTYGDDSPYLLNLNRSISADEISAGQATFNTTGDNPIVFKFDSSKAYSDSGLIGLDAGGYFYNETKITGINKVEVTLASGSATLSYGNAIDVLNVGSAALSGTSLITVNFAEPSDYFRIDDVTGLLRIASLKVSYSCSNNYQYAYDRETASGDLFYTASYSSTSFGTANYPIDRNCFDVVDSSSGFSYHLKTSEAAAGWPVFILDLGHTVDMTNAELLVSAKGINHTAFNYMLLDANDANILSGNRSVTTLRSSWQTFSSGSFVGSVASGKSLTDVAKIKFSFNFSGNPGSVREVFLDELHILLGEEVTRYNLEMTFTRPSTTQTPAGSFSLDTYGDNSTVSRKLDYATATGFNGSGASTYRAFATFNIEGGLGANNGVDFKNSTLSMDIKFSSALVNAEDSRKNTFTLEFTDGAGATASIDASKLTFTMQEGWIHFSKDLSAFSALSSLNGHAKNIRFGFYGIYTGNQADAVIIIDNLAFTANELPTRANLEMCPNMDTSANQTAIGTPIFDDVAGETSVAAKKLTWAHANGFGANETGTYRAFATFDVETGLGASNGVDAKNCTLALDVKFSDELVNSPDANKKYLTVDITDSANATGSMGAGSITFTMTSGWIHITKDLSAVSALSSLNGNTKKIRLGFYGVYTGNKATVSVLVDNLALYANETPTRNNTEMCPSINYNNNQTALGTNVFDEVTGAGSTAARKLTWAHAGGFNGTASGTYRAFAKFDVATGLGASNGIDVKDCTFSMDIKFSDELVNSTDTRKNTFTFELADSSNHAKELAANNFSFTMSDGWIHISKDLSTLSGLESFDGNLSAIRFGFYGVYTGNQATAYIIIDNMAFTAN